MDRSGTENERRIRWEREYLIEGLTACNGNQSKTAAYLGLSRRTVGNWLKRWPDLYIYASNASKNMQKLKREGNLSAGE